MTTRSWGTIAALLLGGAACAPASPHTDVAPAAVSTRSTGGEVPPGLGSLKQDDIALRLSLGALQLRAIPLEESIIQVLAPDSYRSLRDLRASQGAAIREVVARTQGSGTASVWYLSFYSSEPGETRYTPSEVVVTSGGRDFRPLEIIPLTGGFGSQRLRQRESQSALFVFDGQLDVNQALTLQYESTRATDWTGVLERVERERALLRTRSR